VNGIPNDTVPVPAVKVVTLNPPAVEVEEVSPAPTEIT
jgi:hypothetical protein